KLGVTIVIDEKIGKQTYRTIYYLSPQEDHGELSLRGRYVVMRLWKKSGKLQNEIKYAGPINFAKTVEILSEAKKPRKVLNIKIQPALIP
ncbi:MAG: hypothetical protein J7L79_01505, partial [Thaumarchaeota archaeon]|nr:hypothetical protein [Nitrososphaerota archaeon]